MGLTERLHTTWQTQAAQRLASVAEDAPAWVISLALHLALMVVLATANVAAQQEPETLSLSTSPVIEVDELQFP